MHLMMMNSPWATPRRSELELVEVAWPFGSSGAPPCAFVGGDPGPLVLRRLSLTVGLVAALVWTISACVRVGAVQCENMISSLLISHIVMCLRARLPATSQPLAPQ